MSMDEREITKSEVRDLVVVLPKRKKKDLVGFFCKRCAGIIVGNDPTHR